MRNWRQVRGNISFSLSHCDTNCGPSLPLMSAAVRIDWSQIWENFSRSKLWSQQPHEEMLWLQPLSFNDFCCCQNKLMFSSLFTVNVWRIENKSVCFWSQKGKLWHWRQLQSLRSLTYIPVMQVAVAGPQSLLMQPALFLPGLCQMFLSLPQFPPLQLQPPRWEAPHPLSWASPPLSRSIPPSLGLSPLVLRPL